jgi:hypothetical protein
MRLRQVPRQHIEGGLRVRVGGLEQDFQRKLF